MIGLSKWQSALVSLLVTAALSACGHKDAEPTTRPLGTSTTSSQLAPSDAVTTLAFWNWFQTNAAALHAEKNLQEVMGKINEQIERSYPGIFVEIGEDGAQRTLVISADGDKKLFPVVRQVYAARPNVSRWNIVAFRQRDKEPFALEMHGIKLDPKAMKYVAEHEPDKLSITVFVPGFTETDEMKQGLYMVLDHTIGELDMETRIGGIGFAPIEKAPRDAAALTGLPALIDQTFPHEAAH